MEVDLPYDVYVKEGEAVEAAYLEACEWLKSLNMYPASNRFDAYKRALEKFASQPRADEDIKKSFYEWMNAHLEAVDLIRTKAALSATEASEFISQLKKVTSGHGFRQFSSSDQSRDFAFELSIASRFITGGYQVKLSGIADVSVITDDGLLFVECKRVKSHKKLAARVSEANKQLLRRISGQVSSKARGIAAICLTDLLNPKNAMGVFRSEPEVKALSSNTLNSFVLQHRTIFETGKESRLLGMLAELGMQGLIFPDVETRPALINCRGLTFLRYGTQESDNRRVDALLPRISNQDVFVQS